MNKNNAAAGGTSANNIDAQHVTNNNGKDQNLEPPPSTTSFFQEILSRLNPLGKSTQNTANSKNNVSDKRRDQSDKTHNSEQPNNQVIQHMIKRSCRAPLSRKFAHPCTCSQPNNHHKIHANSSGPLPPAAYSIPLHLWDPHTKKCLPTSRTRDMLLKECRPSIGNPLLPHQMVPGPPCVYDDLMCDARRNRCVCKPSLHLYYESNATSFGCVPIGSNSSPDGRTNCRSGYVYNVISKDCQRIFDVNELPPTYTTGVSATQFSFVTIVLIWILLLILIVTAKLRKFRTSNMYRNSPSSERRLHYECAYRNQGQGASAWLHPFIAAVNGHHHMNQHRRTIDRQTTIDESGNYNDTDFFLSNGRRLNGVFQDNNFTGSQQSLNNPPPKFEEIYPSCPEDRQESTPRPPPPPPSNEDLPSYDEAMKLQNTMPPNIPVNSKE